MVQAIVDPEDVEQFARLLNEFNQQLDSQLQGLRGQFDRLGDTWRDREHVKFAEQFVEAVQVLERFMQAADEHAPFLMRKAQKARDYLEQQ